MTESSYRTKHLVRRFIGYYRPHIRLFSMDMGASIAVALIGMIYPIVTRTMLNRYIPEHDLRMIIVSGGLLLLLYTLKMFLNYFIQYKGHEIGVLMQAQMRSEMFSHLEKLSYTYFDNHETGKIMSRMTNDLQDISELAHHAPENILISSFSMIFAFIYLVRINLPLTLIVFGCVPFVVFITFKLRREINSAFRKVRIALAEINANVEGSIGGIRVTKAFNQSQREQEKFETGNLKFVKAKKIGYIALGHFHSGTQFVTDVFNVVVMIAGGIFLFNGKLLVGDYSAFIVSVNMFIQPLMVFVNFMETFENGVTGFERFCEIMDEKPETDTPGAKELTDARGHIELKNVSYSYENGRPVLDNVSLDIEKGRKFALVGPSGGGKTTICHLIPRFYDVTDGQILLDGQDIRGFTLESLRRNIGIVQQDVYLFNASIAENIRYGRIDATDEEIRDAARRARIDSYIMGLADGYDTNIGERGVRLSGGQKQRLSIARAFLKNPPILILDEATSALDNTTEILIQQALDELCAGRTTIVVAHRLSTVRNADEIAVVSRGRIIELGTHDELMNSGGVYSVLYALQFKDSDVDESLSDENPE